MDKPTGWFYVCVCAGLATLHVSVPPVCAEDIEASVMAPSALAERFAAYLHAVQHPSTGLPTSFAHSVNHALDRVAFTYDVAVTALALTRAGSDAAAKRALHTYARMPLPTANAWFFNTAYQVQTQQPILEYRVHGGPIFWMAIALMRYAQATGDQESLQKGVALLEWARTHLPHTDGGVAMSHRDMWRNVMSVENNWVYYGALRVATQLLPEGDAQQRLMEERHGVRRWLDAHGTERSPNDSVKALDVYTHALLVGPQAHEEDGSFADAAALSAWAKSHIQELDTFFQVPGAALYDYTDQWEAVTIGRAREGWLEGTEQVVVAYLTWATWFEQQGDLAYAKQLRMKAAASHQEVLRYLLPTAGGAAIPTTAAVLPFLTFMGGWETRPSSEPALNGTTWAYFGEVGYNPFVHAMVKRR